MPRCVYGPLKEVVLGMACCGMASACWTREEVFNGGQLGYDRAAQPVQVLQRKGMQILRQVIDLAMKV